MYVVSLPLHSIAYRARMTEWPSTASSGIVSICSLHSQYKLRSIVRRRQTYWI